MESERKYERVIQNLAEAIYICDADGHIKLYNRAAAEIWGREPELGKELYCGGWHVLDVNGQAIPVESNPLVQAYKEGKPIHGSDVIIQRPDGSIRQVIQFSTPLYDSSGNFIGAVNMLVDVTGKPN
jgi:PAS domain S-box-containing protein